MAWEIVDIDNFISTRFSDSLLINVGINTQSVYNGNAFPIESVGDNYLNVTSQSDTYVWSRVYDQDDFAIEYTRGSGSYANAGFQFLLNNSGIGNKVRTSGSAQLYLNSVAICVNHDLQYAQLCTCWAINVGTSSQLTIIDNTIGNATNARNFYTWVVNHPHIYFNWAPVSHLSGNDEQFYLNLSQIGAEYIGDPFTSVITTDRNRFIFFPQSNIARLIANVPNNFETPIVYCGNNYMTVTRRFSEGIAPYNNIFFKFKFYYEDGTLAYETEEYGISEPAIAYRYLSFVMDLENEVAWIDQIEESLTNDNILYNDPPADLPSTQDLYNIWLWLQNNGETHTEDDPYATGSTDDGGDPGNPRPQDHITDTPAPTLSGLNLGIITLYSPDDYELGKISQFLWSDAVLDNFKKYFNNFADNILALYVLPFTPVNLPTKAFTVGKMTSDDAALQAVSYCTQRYFDIDMGSVQIDGRWDSYLDYAPYTRIEVYLPYCGLHSLDIDELMSPAKQNGTLPADQGCTLSLKYRLDILTGVIVAKLAVNGEIRYQFNGKVGVNIPLTGQTFSNLLGAIVGAAGGAAVTVATGGMTAPLAVGAAASAAGTVMAQKPNVESIGNISADASMLATKIPYVRISSPNKPLLEKQQDFTGFPSYKSGTLSQFSGYTEVLEAHIEGIACTEEERSEILSLLKAGVIL